MARIRVTPNRQVLDNSSTLPLMMGRPQGKRPRESRGTEVRRKARMGIRIRKSPDDMIGLVGLALILVAIALLVYAATATRARSGPAPAAFPPQSSAKT